MDQFVRELQDQGICKQTVDEHSKKDGSKWKVYYQSINHREYGILIGAGQNEDFNPSRFRQKLSKELENYKKLQEGGYDTPNYWPEVIQAHDHLIRGSAVPAIVVEHIKGSGPYKTTTDSKSIMMVGNSFDETVRERVKKSWENLTTSAAKIMPMDHQVIVSDDGRLVTIDPENCGPGRQLCLWDDSLIIKK